MFITVKLLATYRIGRFKEKVLECPTSALVQQILDNLSIPNSERSIVLVNGNRVELSHPLQEGDILTLLPLVSGG